MTMIPAAQRHPPVPDGDVRYEAPAAQALLSGPRSGPGDCAEYCQRVRGGINSSIIARRAVAVRAISTRRHLISITVVEVAAIVRTGTARKTSGTKIKTGNGTRIAIGRGKMTVTGTSTVLLRVDCRVRRPRSTTTMNATERFPTRRRPRIGICTADHVACVN